MQGFCLVISDHLVGWTIFNVNVTFDLLIRKVEVLDVEMTRALACTLASISLEQHSTFIVLVWDILLDWISLCSEEQSCPHRLGDIFISGNNFHFGRTSGVHTLSPAEGGYVSFTHCEG